MKIYSENIQKEICRISDDSIGLKADSITARTVKMKAECALSPLFGFPVTVEVTFANDGFDMKLKISKKAVDVDTVAKVASYYAPSSPASLGAWRSNSKYGAYENPLSGKCGIPSCGCY